MSDEGSIALLWSVALILASLAAPVAGETSEKAIYGALGDDASSGVARAVEYVLSCQNDDGGFGNGVGKPSDQRESPRANSRHAASNRSVR